MGGDLPHEGTRRPKQFLIRDFSDFLLTRAQPVAVKIPKDMAKYDVQSWLQEMQIMRCPLLLQDSTLFLFFNGLYSSVGSRNWHPNIALYMGTCVKDGFFMIGRLPLMPTPTPTPTHYGCSLSDGTAARGPTQASA